MLTKYISFSVFFQVANESHGRKSDESHFHVLVVSKAMSRIPFPSNSPTLASALSDFWRPLTG